MIEDNKVVQSQFNVVVQERNRLRQSGDVGFNGLLVSFDLCVCNWGVHVA